MEHRRHGGQRHRRRTYRGTGRELIACHPLRGRSPMSVPLLSRRVAPLVVAPMLWIAACGARGPLDITVVEETSDAAVDVVEASVDAKDASDASDAAPDQGMGPGLPDSGPIACVTCIGQSCGA